MFTNLFKRKEKGPIPDFKDVHVTLKPIFGIRPGIYLTAIYGIIIALVIFLLFFLPGIVDAGTYITFTSEPVRAGVWIDGKKAGNTPCEILVRQGVHEITFSRPSFKPVTLKREVGGSIFAIPFLPKKDRIDATLEVKDIQELTQNAFRDFSEWALVEGFSNEYQYPPILAEAVKSIYASPTEETYLALKKLLAGSLPSVCLPELAADWSRALFTVETKGTTLSPAGIRRLINDIRDYAGTYDNLPFLLYTILPKKLTAAQPVVKTDGKTRASFPVTKDDLLAQPWFAQRLAKYQAFLSGFKTATGPRSKPGISVAGVFFNYIPDGTYMMGKTDNYAALLNLEYLDQFPHPVKVNGFYIAQTEVTNAQYKLFTDENPVWRTDNKERLMERGLVNEEYLKDWKDNSYPDGRASYPVTYVSANAADAYCAWLSDKAQGLLSGSLARLPSEAEWEWAAAGGDPDQFHTAGSVFLRDQTAGAQTAGTQPVGSSAPNIFGLVDMAGNVFEWCQDWYAKGAPMVSSSHAERNGDTLSAAFKDGGQRSVRGGSWAIAAEEITVSTRACQPADFCTPWLGFRPVIAEK
jgi:formylglycine-generating enzyme required for sulfatase activity